MAIDRRAVLGAGFLGLGAAVTGGVVVFRDKPGVQQVLGEKTPVRGLAGGAKADFLADAAAAEPFAQAALALQADDAGSLELLRDPVLLARKPDFLWPSSSALTELAGDFAPPLGRQAPLSSPLVIHSWAYVAEALVRGGVASRPGQHYIVDVRLLVEAVLAGKAWSDLGLSQVDGAMRLAAADPNTSGSGLLFAGLAAAALSGGQDVAATTPRIAGLFKGMGFAPNSAARVFDAYLGGGPAACPLALGYESQLLAWALADADRWKRAAAGAERPVMLYLQPAMLASQPLIALTARGARLLDLFASQPLRQLAWARHGLRDARGTPGPSNVAALRDLAPPAITAAAAPLGAAAMLGLLQALRQS